METSNNPLLQAVLSVIVLVAFGSPKDPVNDIVEQAEKLKRSEEGNAGDPPAT